MSVLLPLLTLLLACPGPCPEDAEPRGDSQEPQDSPTDTQQQEPEDCLVHGPPAQAWLYGTDSNQYLGRSLCRAGDINADGWPDVLVGATGDNAGGERSGAFYLLLGPLSGALDASQHLQLTGREANDQTGNACAFAGDATGDGINDLLLAASMYDSEGSDRGAAYLMAGPITRSISVSEHHGMFVGEEDYDQAGWSVAAGGDINGDGVGDILIGSDKEDSAARRAGSVYLIHGPISGPASLSGASVKLQGVEEGDAAGMSVAILGDIDGDGFDDLACGAPYSGSGSSSEDPADRGSTYLLHGPLSGDRSLGDAELILLGEANADYAGLSLAAAGDTDGDGHPDLLVGAYGQDAGGSNAGAAYLISGALLGSSPAGSSMNLAEASAVFTGASSFDYLGQHVAGGGDADGDGLDDLLLGAPGHDAGGDSAGAVFLLLGPQSGAGALDDAAACFPGERAFDLAWRASSAGDLDGDGASELLLGAYGQDSGAQDGGAVYIFPGGF